MSGDLITRAVAFQNQEEVAALPHVGVSEIPDRQSCWQACSSDSLPHMQRRRNPAVPD